ncbi:hypothetical protein EG329_003352 [Mollisiaceae sp. DMI_Dod_QoI]|nr:hypothetical protein EG329_003352 [Helotiales sp. DMI_Dod_QoI]
MEPDNANFIPLGSGPGSTSRPLSHPLSRSTKVIGQTKEERQKIAREYRLAAKKAKKKEKADAKRARKLNGILHRRMTKNPEKYTKNKERNRQRAIDLERQKIQFGAVHQCERLAAKHDPSGNMFNVGEVIVTPEGKVKSKEALRREAEREAQQKAEKEAEATQPRNKRISKNQLKRQEMLKPKPVPPKPIIPDGITLPEDEENLVQLWDITDQEIEARLKKQKAAKRQAGKQLRKIQKEQKKLNRAMKLRKKQCAYAGVTWDPERARREIIGQMTKDAEDESDSDSDSSEDDSDSEGQTNGKTSKEAEKRASFSEKLEPIEGRKKLPEVQRPRLDLTLIAQAEELARQRAEKKTLARKKRREERKAKAEEEAKKAEEDSAVQETEKVDVVEPAEKKSEKKRKRSRDGDDESRDSGKEKSHKKKKANKEGTLEFKTEEAKPKLSGGDEIVKKTKAKAGDAEATTAGMDEHTTKKKKRDRLDSETEETELARKEERKRRKLQESNDEKLDRQIAEREAKMKVETERNGRNAIHNGAEHWNPDALAGDSARKDKFLRLLGAGKNGVDQSTADQLVKKAKKEKRSKDKNSFEEISKVQTELERQYEAGMKMKHDGGSKKRGLGA